MDACTRIECLPGTCADILQFIDDWQSNTEAEQCILWLYGLAGSGKSMLATTVANLFSKWGCLGAFVFFDQDVQERNQPSNIIRTIAHQLGSFDAQLGAAIAAVIDNMPRISLSPLSLQFMKLLVGPLSTVPWTKSSIVIVMDALDECVDRKCLLTILAAESIRLPPFIHIIMASGNWGDPDMTSQL
jgi:Cdc6-like AAA superfamily ATPase